MIKKETYKMRPTLFALFSAVICSGALADPVGHIGNTLLIKRTTGVGKLLYRADKTFTLYAIGGKLVNGTWAAKDGKVCLTPTQSTMKPFCVKDDPVHKVGDTWSAVSPDGIQETLTLVAGQE